MPEWIKDHENMQSICAVKHCCPFADTSLELRPEVVHHLNNNAIADCPMQSQQFPAIETERMTVYKAS